MKNKIPLVVFSILFLVGCAVTNSVSLTKSEYKMALGFAVCSAVKNLNTQGILADAEKFGGEFESAVREEVEKMGYHKQEWLAAKKKFFTSEEHKKLLKFHFTWCLVNSTTAE